MDAQSRLTFLESLDHVPEAHPNDLADLLKLNQVETALPTLVLADEGLGHTKTLRDVGLSETGASPVLTEQRRLGRGGHPS